MRGSEEYQGFGGLFDELKLRVLFDAVASIEKSLPRQG